MRQQTSEEEWAVRRRWLTACLLLGVVSVAAVVANAPLSLLIVIWAVSAVTYTRFGQLYYRHRIARAGADRSSTDS